MYLMLMPDFLDSPTSLQSCLNNCAESLSLIAYNSKFSFYSLRLSQLGLAPSSVFRHCHLIGQENRREIISKLRLLTGTCFYYLIRLVNTDRTLQSTVQT